MTHSMWGAHNICGHRMCVCLWDLGKRTTFGAFDMKTINNLVIPHIMCVFAHLNLLFIRISLWNGMYATKAIIMFEYDNERARTHSLTRSVYMWSQMPQLQQAVNKSLNAFTVQPMPPNSAAVTLPLFSILKLSFCVSHLEIWSVSAFCTYSRMNDAQRFSIICQVQGMRILYIKYTQRCMAGAHRDAFSLSVPVSVSRK